MAKKTQTAKQLAAEKANLVKARAALAKKKAALRGSSSTSAFTASGKPKLTLMQRRGIDRARQVEKLSTLRHPRHPLGSTEPGFNLHKKSHLLHKITGINRKVPKRIAPTSQTGSGGWKQSRTHHHRKRLYVRKKKMKVVKDWRRRKRSMRPR